MPLSGVVLALTAAGCACGRPAPLLVEPSNAVLTKKEQYGQLHLRMVTYNIWGLPSWMTGARGGRYPRICHELEQLDPDLILLQEAWTAHARTAAPHNSHWSIARAAGQRSFFQQSGLVTLSRFPIIGGEFYPFTRSAFPDRFVNKGVLKVTVRLPDEQVINVWNVHLQDGGSEQVKLSQIRELVSRVRAAQDGQVADLVGGDFNCTPESAMFCQLTNSLGPSVQQLGGGEPFVTWDGLSAKPGAGETLDYIFIRGGVFKGQQASPRAAFTASNARERLSDHLGIEADIGLGFDARLAGGSALIPEDSRWAARAPMELDSSDGD